MERGKLIGQGRTAEVFAWGEDKIIKLFRKEMPKGAAESEYRFSRELSSMGLPVPKVYGLVEQEGRWGIIYEWIKGPSMMRILASRPWTVSREARRMAEVHKAIQVCTHAEIPTYKSRLKESIGYTELLTDEKKAALFKYIDQLPEGEVLCHADFHPDNILISKGRAVVIDWMTAVKGVPQADAARTSVMLKCAVIPEEKPYVERKVVGILRNRLLSIYMKHYLEITNSSVEQVEQWEMPIAAARLTEWLSDEEKKALLKLVDEGLNR